MPGVTGTFVIDGLKAGCRVICFLRTAGLRGGVPDDTGDSAKPELDESFVFSAMMKYK